MKQLHPKSVWLFFFSSLYSFLIVFIMFSIVFFNVLIHSLDPYITSLNRENSLLIIALCFLFVFLFFLFFFFLWAKLSYRYYKYELKEQGFYKERGVIIKKYITIPYDRIQNVDIYRGILSRILGLSDLQIQTAGTGLSGGRGHMGFGAEGRLPGLSVKEAEEIREELIKRSQRIKNQGV